VNGDVKPDARLARLAERYAAPLDVPVGEIGKIGATPKERLALTADALALAWKAAAGTDVGLQPEGDLFEVFRTPEVTRYQVHAIVPFHDTVWKGEIAGARLRALLEKPTAFGGVMHATIAPADIDPAKTYTVATTDFVAQAMVPDGVDTHLDARDAIEAWLKTKRPRRGQAEPISRSPNAVIPAGGPPRGGPQSRDLLSAAVESRSRMSPLRGSPG
jgi:hypothetical protein